MGKDLQDLIAAGWWCDLAWVLHTEGVEVLSNSTVNAATWGADLEAVLRGTKQSYEAPKVGSPTLGQDQFWDAMLAVRAGVTLADLRSVAAPVPHAPSPTQAVTVLLASSGAAVFANLSLATMIGWILASPPDWDEMANDRWDYLPVRPWVDAGLGNSGWLYAAAGLHPAEALACMRDGSLTAQDAAVLAALRGVPVPTGTALPVLG